MCRLCRLHVTTYYVVGRSSTVTEPNVYKDMDISTSGCRPPRADQSPYYDRSLQRYAPETTAMDPDY